MGRPEPLPVPVRASTGTTDLSGQWSTPTGCTVALKRLEAAHADPVSPSEVNGAAMLDEILRDAETKLGHKDDQSIRRADKSYADWMGAAPAPNCTSD